MIVLCTALGVARDEYEHEHLCRKCFGVIVCFRSECPIDYANGQWLGDLSLCFDCAAEDAPTSTRRKTIPYF